MVKQVIKKIQYCPRQAKSRIIIKISRVAGMRALPGLGLPNYTPTCTNSMSAHNAAPT